MQAPENGSNQPPITSPSAAARRCRNCGAPTGGGGQRCASCLSVERERKRAYAETGRCTRCSGPADRCERRLCSKCATADRERRLANEYGLSSDERLAMEVAQAGACAVWRASWSGGTAGGSSPRDRRNPSVDLSRLQHGCRPAGRVPRPRAISRCIPRASLHGECLTRARRHGRRRLDQEPPPVISPDLEPSHHPKRPSRRPRSSNAPTLRGKIAPSEPALEEAALRCFVQGMTVLAVDLVLNGGMSSSHPPVIPATNRSARLVA